MIVKNKKYVNGSIQLLKYEEPSDHWLIRVYYKKILVDTFYLLSKDIAESVFLKYKEIIESHLSHEFEKVVNKLKGERK